MQVVEPGMLLYTGFVLLAVCLLAGLLFIVRSWTFAFCVAGWAALMAALAFSGVTADFSSFPPRALLLVLFGFFSSVAIAFSPVGTRLCKLSITFLVGFMSYRIVVELLIHQAVVEGVAPAQMSWNGWNFDIVAGVTALFLVPFAKRLSNKVLLIWNTIALCLVIWTISVAIRSLPTPIQQFEPVGLWVTQFPFVWLPSVLVPLALLGHMVIYRKLLGSHR